MSNLEYYLLWLAAGLVVTAAVSAVIAWRLRRRVMRRVKSAELLDALSRHTEWVAAQHRALLLQGGARTDDTPLEEVRAISAQWFPELRADTRRLLAVDSHLKAFLRTQQRLRSQDAEAWLDSDYDIRFVALWREHLAATEPIVGKLPGLAGLPEAPARRSEDTARTASTA
jgi:hypothetical protein